MNTLDIVLLVVLAAALISGWRAGLFAGAASWIGRIVGVGLSAWTVPWALARFTSGAPTTRLLLGALVFIATVAICSRLFAIAGRAVSRVFAGTPLGAIDRAAGAVAGIALVAVLTWFVAPVAAEVPGAVSREVRGSTLIGVLSEHAPERRPDVLAALRPLIDQSHFPEVFEHLRPTPPAGPPPEDVAIPAEVVQAATGSTARVSALGCGRRYDGSAFVVADGLLATNAHVVAGADDVTVRFPGGEQHAATVVVFDPERDLALLRADDVTRTPLELAAAAAGEDAAVIGYPGGQRDPRVAPARVERRTQALGRDVYGRERTERAVLFLAAELERGDSGSPVIDKEGRAVGVVFAISPDRRDVAYALDIAELQATMAAPRQPGETGACL